MPEISIEPQQNPEASEVPKVLSFGDPNPETNPTVSKSKLKKLEKTLSWDAFTKKEDSLKTLLENRGALKGAIISQSPEHMFDALTIFNTAVNYLGYGDYSSFEPPENKDDFVKLAQEVVNYNCENGVFDNYLNDMDRKIAQRTMLNKIFHKTPSSNERQKEISDKLEVRKDVLNLVVFAISNSSPGDAERSIDFLARHLTSTLKLAQEGVAAGCKDERAFLLGFMTPLSSKITASDAKPLVDSLISLLENKQFQ